MTTALPRQASEHAVLLRRMTDAGLMDRRPGYYAFRFAVLGLFLAATVAAFVLLGDSWWQLAVAVAAAFGSGQTALLAHDVAHRQVFRGRRASAVVGRVLGNLGIGMSYGWWTDKHTRHHANPNHEGLDPDVEPGVVVFAAGQALPTTSGFAAFIQRNQRAMFFPLITLQAIDLRRGSALAIRDGRMPWREGEALLMFAHVAVYLGVLCTMLPFGLAVAFLVVHQALFGVYLGLVFAPNHKGMEMPTTKLDFVRKQVLTSRNVRGNRFTDRPLHVLMGGLNHQIEHHLFPNMPTANLRRARVLTKAYCTEIGVPYYETGLVRSWAEILRSLHDAGAPLRDVQERRTRRRET
jgi:fatty acid desaturase